MYSDDILKHYIFFENNDKRKYSDLQETTRQYLTAEQAEALQDIINIYNSPVLKWERFMEYLRRRPTKEQKVISAVERRIYTAAENGERVHILNELETALEAALEAEQRSLILNSIV